jgi:hypothetical protein
LLDLPITALDLGYPLMTSASGGRFVVHDDGDAYDHHEVLWRYLNLTLTWIMSLTNSYGFDLQGDPQPRTRLCVYFHGANGTLYVSLLSLKLGCSIRFNPQTESIIGDGEAARRAVPESEYPKCDCRTRNPIPDASRADSLASISAACRVLPGENWSQGAVPDRVNGRRVDVWRRSGAFGLAM